MKKEKLKSPAREDSRPTDTPANGNGHGELRRVPLDQIDPSPFQNRKTFLTADWPDFVATVRTSGVIQPGVGREVNGRIELVCGERRFRASGEVGLPDMPLIIRPLTDEQVMEMVAIENLQREGLNPIEEAQGYADWIRRLTDTGKTKKEAIEHISERVGRKRATIYERLSLLTAGPALQLALLEGKVDFSKTRLLATVPKDRQEELLRDVLNAAETGRPYSVRDLEEYIENDFRVSLNDAPFDLQRVYSGEFEDGNCSNNLKTMGACEECPLRTGNMTEEFPEYKNSPNGCTKPPCYRAKIAANIDAILSAAKAKGQRVLGESDYAKECASLVQERHWCYDFGETMRWGELMGKHAPMPILSATEDGIRECWTKEEARAAAIANGYKLPEPKPKAPASKSKSKAEKTPQDLERDEEFIAQQKRDEAKRNAEREREARQQTVMLKTAEVVGARLQDALEAKPQDAKTEAAFLRFYMSQPAFQDNLGCGMNEAMNRRGIKTGNLTKAVEKLKLPQLRSLLIGILIGDDLVSDFGDGYAPEFVNACKLAGIDLKAEEKKVKDSLEPKQEKTKAAAPQAVEKPKAKAAKKPKKK